MNHKPMPNPRVLKLGGSLLLLPDWPQRLMTWLEDQPAALNLLLVGGGKIVNAVRELDTQHSFPAAFSHWLCIDLMSATARIAGQLLPACPLLTSPAELQQVLCGSRSSDFAGKMGQHSSRPAQWQSLTFIVDVPCFYRAPTAISTQSADDSGLPLVACPLPESWDTTSDSLAAWLAIQVGATELVLFKSTAPVIGEQTPQAWVEQAIVDAAFADVLPATLSVTIVNLLEP